MYNKLTCLFGYHDYGNGDKITVDKYGYRVRLCKICKRSAFRKLSDGSGIWYDYDDEGNVIHTKYPGGHETWYSYDVQGNMIHKKWGSVRDIWKANDGRWVFEKPKNWKYEKDS